MSSKLIQGNVFADDRGFFRAWHGHKKEAKYIYVPKGSALVGIVDLETEEISKFTLTRESPSILYVPPNYANGFQTLTSDAIMMFFSTSTLEESKGDDYRFEWDRWNIWEENYR